MRGLGIRNGALVVVAMLGAPLLGGCGGVSRTEEQSAQMLQEREQMDAASTRSVQEHFAALARRVKTEMEAYHAGKASTPPKIDILIISGGGDWGAFGAGFLKGWGQIPAGDAMARPRFDIVTGVSTGALIAPFAFVGDEECINEIDHLYRNPQSDWVKERGMLYFLPHNISFAEVPGLERELKAALNKELLQKIVDRAADGSVLAVNATNLDDAGPHPFMLDDEARRAMQTGDCSRLQNMMLASAGIPGAFPYREIDGSMYVDGGVTANIMYGGRIGEEDSIPALWQTLYPGETIPKIRYWVLFNNKIRNLPMTVKPRWPSIITRSLELSVRASTLTAIRHLYAMSEVSRLKRHADIEVRVAAIPNDWVPPKEGTFVKESMNNLADLGVRMGADPKSWSTTPPLE